MEGRREREGTVGTERGREAREGIEEGRQLTEEREGEKVERPLRE